MAQASRSGSLVIASPRMIPSRMPTTEDVWRVPRRSIRDYGAIANISRAPHLTYIIEAILFPA